MTTKQLTLVSVPEGTGRGQWTNGSAGTGERVIIIENYNTFREAIRASLTIDSVYVARVVIDRSIDTAEFLRFLASLPVEFRGDVLYLASDGSAFLSSVLRDGGRSLHELHHDDVRFYLGVHGMAFGSGSRVVLVVDRDAATREAIATAAAAAGAELVLATTSGEAVRFAASVRPALIFVDDLHAFDVPPTIRGLDPAYAPVIAAASAMDRNLRRASEIEHYFAKPLDEGEIIEFVHWALAGESQRLAS